jgi:hemin uptake protein HemP
MRTSIPARRVTTTEPREPSDRSGPRRIDSPTLFGEDREVVIVHQAQEYRLRITKADKLILTK